MSAPPDQRLMLLDTPSLYFRAFYGVPDSVRSPRGEPVNAVRGLLDMVARLIAEWRPTHLVAAMDHDWRPAFRVALLPSYKAHRVADVDANAEVVPDLLSPQVPVIEALLAAIGIAVVGAADCEADDVIGTLATHATAPVDIVTGDRDLFQLVDDARSVRVLYTQKGLANLAVFDEAEVSRRYGIPGKAYADFALLRGDPSDGLPGVPGVGEKTAAALLARWGSLDAMLTAIDGGSGDGLGKVAGSRAYIDAARPVVAVVCDADVPAHDATLPRTPRNPDALDALVDRWGVGSAVGRLLAALAS